MRKTIFTLLALAFFFSLNAQVITDPIWATFEDDAPNVFANIQWEGAGTLSIQSNPNVDGINKSNKCLSISYDIDHNWWDKLYLKPAEGSVIKQNAQENIFLHIKGLRTKIGEESEIQIFNSADELIYQLRFNNTKAGVWEDFVFDLSSESDAVKKPIEEQEIAKILIVPQLNFDGPIAAANICYFDDFKLISDSYPEGVNRLKDVNKIFDFDDENLTAKNIFEFAVMSAEASYSIVANPKETAVNPSKKVMRYNKPANTTWWHSLDAAISGIIDVEYPNTYMHCMVYNPKGEPFEILVKDHMGKTYTQEFFSYDAAEWEDFVMDISTMQTIKNIYFRFNVTERDNWANPAGIYYLDDVVIDDNPDTRTTITNSINTNSIEKYYVYSDNGTIKVKGEDIMSVELFSLTGVKCATRTAVTDEVSFSIAKGTYLVKIKFANGRTISQLTIN